MLFTEILFLVTKSENSGTPKVSSRKGSVAQKQILFAEKKKLSLSPCMKVILLTMISLPQNLWKVFSCYLFSLKLINSFFGPAIEIVLKLFFFVSHVLHVYSCDSVLQPGNDVSQRINRARHFMRAASSCLNRTEVIHSFMKILCSQYTKCKCKHFCFKLS